MFGKPYSEYVKYQWPFLVAMVAVGLLRLVLSIAGQPNSIVKYVSVTVVGIIGSIYYAATVRRSGFGSYKELLPLIFNQGLVANAIAILGIGIAVMGYPNAFDAPEFRGPFATAETTPLQHALAHLFIGTTVGTLMGWAITSLLMLIFGGRRK